MVAPYQALANIISGSSLNYLTPPHPTPLFNQLVPGFYNHRTYNGNPGNSTASSLTSRFGMASFSTSATSHVAYSPAANSTNADTQPLINLSHLLNYLIS